MGKKFLILLLFCPFLFLHAQNNVLTHIVKSGETISQIASLYKAKVKDIYTLNNIGINGIIKAGQKLLIPMSSNSANVKAEKPEIKLTNNTSNTRYHIIEPGESLYKIAKDNNVSVQQLRKWNNLENDNIKIGEYIYFQQQKSKVVITDTKPIVSQEEVVKQSLKKDIKDSDYQAKVIDQVIENNQYQKPEKTISKPESSIEKIESNLFEKQYKPTNKSLMGLCGTFKTISGWKDKKYYALMNDAVNGSIVKVKLDNKYIYAKVLGPLPNIKDDGSLMIRISNAAAAALGVNYDLFEVKVEL
jgi:LysM repeat protein